MSDIQKDKMGDTTVFRIKPFSDPKLLYVEIRCEIKCQQNRFLISYKVYAPNVSLSRSDLVTLNTACRELMARERDFVTRRKRATSSVQKKSPSKSANRKAKR